MAADRPTDDTDLQELVELCLLRIETDGSSVVEEICAAHPRHAAKLRERIDALRRHGLIEAEPRLDPAERLGEFVLGRCLGSGGMGVVYLARQERLGREVAVKIVRPERLYFPGSRERFQREIEAAARLEHPGVVRVFSVGETDGIPHFAMEVVRGASLFDVIDALRASGRSSRALDGADLRAAVVERVAREHPGTRDDGSDDSAAVEGLYRGSWVEVCFRIALNVAQTLAHAHARGVVHRDVKPSNIMITPGGRVVLLDFGLAHTEEGHDLTGSGAQLGSLPYMAPEQVAGDRTAPVELADVYGLGATLFELLTLHPRFDDRDADTLRDRILRGLGRAPTEYLPRLPRDADLIVGKATATEPRHRYASAADFARDLQNFLELRPIEARPASRWYRTRKLAQRHPARATALSAAVLVVLAAPLVYALSEARAARRALGEKQRAEENLTAARAVLQRTLLRLGNDYLTLVPGYEEVGDFDAVRREILEDVHRFYGELRPEQEGEPRQRFELARTEVQIANLRARLGELDTAEQELIRAEASLADLVQSHPEALATRWLAVAITNLGLIERLRGNRPEYLGQLARAAEILRDGLERYPDDPGLRRELLLNYHQLCGQQMSRGEREPAVATLERFRALVAAAADPDSPQERFRRAQLLGDEARIGYFTDGYDVAKQLFQDGIALIESIEPEALPSSDRFSRKLETHQLYTGLAGMAQQHGELDLAMQTGRKALEKSEELCRLAPARVELRLRKGMDLSLLATMQLGQGDTEAGMQHLEEARDLYERLLADSPNETDALLGLGRVYSMLAGSVRDEQAVALRRKAGETFERLVAAHPNSITCRDSLATHLLQETSRTEDPEQGHEIAGRAIELLEGLLAEAPKTERWQRMLGLALFAQARAAVGLEHKAEAVALLTRAVRDHGLDPKHLRRPDFSPLADVEGFAELLR